MITNLIDTYCVAANKNNFSSWICRFGECNDVHGHYQPMKNTWNVIQVCKGSNKRRFIPIFLHVYMCIYNSTPSPMGHLTLRAENEICVVFVGIYKLWKYKIQFFLTYQFVDSKDEQK